MDPQRHADPVAEPRRSIPSIQVDYGFGKLEVNEPVVTVLVAIDTETKFIKAIPVESKGSNLSAQAEGLVKFSLLLNYLDKVEFVGDSEPTMKALLSSVQSMRQRLGFQTVIAHAKPEEKGRTAQVERAIQTLRRQSSTLMHMAEDKCRLRLSADHALLPWSYIHAAWTLNRFATHTTTKMAPFELVFGRRYSGKVACFGEVVMVLHRRGVNCKQGPQWVPGVWLGKTDGEDLHAVATPEGVRYGKAIRRTADPWRGVWLFLVKEKPFQTTKRRQAKLQFGGLVTPRPVTKRHPGKGDEAEDYSKDVGGEDIDAQDVQQYARDHPNSDGSGDEDGRERQPKRQDDAPLQRPSKMLKLPPGQEPQADGPRDVGGEVLVDDSEVREPSTKSRKTENLDFDRSGSPSSGRLFSPHYAGSVLTVGAVDDEAWEEEVGSYLEEDIAMEEPESEPQHEGSPPTLSPGDLEQVEIAAGFEEIERLLKMGVIRDPTQEELEQGTPLSTRSVYDWRFRENKWKRSCRFVAREFRGGDRGDATAFAPTSGIGAKLVMLLHVCCGWLATFLSGYQGCFSFGSSTRTGVGSQAKLVGSN